MEELIAQITTIARGMWRFRWYALIVTWIVGVIAAVIAFRVPDQYVTAIEAVRITRQKKK